MVELTSLPFFLQYLEGAMLMAFELHRKFLPCCNSSEALPIDLGPKG